MIFSFVLASALSFLSFLGVFFHLYITFIGNCFFCCYVFVAVWHIDMLFEAIVFAFNIKLEASVLLLPGNGYVAADGGNSTLCHISVLYVRLNGYGFFACVVGSYAEDCCAELINRNSSPSVAVTS